MPKARDIIKRKYASYKNLFATPDGKAVLEDLERQFGGTTLRKNNGVIDPNASIAAAGCREVLLYIENIIKVEEPVDVVD